MFRETTKDFLSKEMPLTNVREQARSSAGFDRLVATRCRPGWTSMLGGPDIDGGSISDERAARRGTGSAGEGGAPGRIQTGRLPPTAGAIIRLLGSETGVRQAEIGTEAAGPLGFLARREGVDHCGIGEEFLMRHVY